MNKIAEEFKPDKMIERKNFQILPSPFEYCSFYYYRNEPEKDLLPHSHNSFQFLYIMSGKFQLQFSKKEILSIKAGDVCVISPEKSHLWSYPGGKQCKAFLFLCGSCSRNVHGEIATLLAPWVKNSYWHITLAPKELFAIIKNIEKEFRNEKIVKKSTILSYNLLLLAKTGKIIMQKHNLPHQNRHIPEPVIKALFYIEKNYMLPISLAELAAEAELATSRFSELFRLHLGNSPIDYLIHFRIKKAESYLRHSNIDIGQIATHTGFSSVHYFSRIFKKTTGKSPSSYRLKKIKS